MEISAEV